MFEFFIALFGILYYVIALCINSNKVNRFDSALDNENARLKCMESLYFATDEQREYINEYVKAHPMELRMEFKDDLTYIFGRGFEDPAKQRLYSYLQFDITESIKNLMLAKKYKRIYGTYGMYKVSPIKSQAVYSLRLFKKINEYVGVDECKLTQCPIESVCGLSWSVYGSVFCPAAWNKYADINEVVSEKWLKFCDC